MRMVSTLKENQPRITTEPLQLGGYHIPAGTVITVDIYCLMHNRKVWGDDADAFVPARHEPQKLNQMPNNVWSWLPFSGGPRKCVGMGLAMAEMRTILAMLLRKYEFDLPEGSIHADKIQLCHGEHPLLIPLDMPIKFTKRY
ncbi:cytochrome P450 [Jimgerdemannia flammicorona]|uniref:Cytochrome P450 n=1 Tax=Jimgerdemannia flammicorona TaxID=994334 RepID=A0A433DMK5_9FUNG|nr:cytochrome P450 [Jimgerdemannia flammicorona]